MICKLCKEFYLDDDTLIGLFTFSEICNHCKVKYEPKRLYEVIPINNGLVEYHYLYENMNLNIKQKEYLSQYLSIFYLELFQHKNSYDLIIFLDDDIYFKTSILSYLVNDYKHVFVFSLMRRELMYKELF